MKKFSKEIKNLNYEIKKRVQIVRICQNCIGQWPKCGISKESFLKAESEIKRLKQLRKYYDFLNTESVYKKFNPISLNRFLANQGYENKTIAELIEKIKSNDVLKKCICIYKIPITFTREDNKEITITKIYTFELNKYSIAEFEIKKYTDFLIETQENLSKREGCRIFVAT